MFEIHDSEIKSYTVNIDDDDSSIVFTLLLADKKYCNLIFENMLAFNFEEQNNYQNVIRDISEGDITKFVDKHKSLLEEGVGKVLPLYYTDAAKIKEHLLINSYKTFYIAASQGLNGWIISKNMVVKPETKES